MRIIIECDINDLDEYRLAREIRSRLETKRQVFGLPIIIQAPVVVKVTDE